ncbi:HD-GYP domain-containing protein [Acetonema longum]|uniref:Metal dependent phosphohydrolase n=1 Tax=Acetonema longum DSM 6540 TaxID=1009370 RepID=F7NDX1_9FIRM|nr:HD-GYP domain-containing protein [Acetonema longum]EGO65786.1 metal dependent phosphohydrolase [Acetonema longum DSM 6540]
MRRILIENAIPGLKLVQPVFGTDGQTILSAGTEITEFHIKRLQEIVRHIYVEEAGTEVIEDTDRSAQDVRFNVLLEAYNIVNGISVGKHVDIFKEKEQVLVLLDELCQRKDIQPVFIALRNYNDYLFEHSINVFFISMLIAIDMEFDRSRLRELGVGSLLHDTGMLQIPAAIVNKPGKLTIEETREVKKHTELGYELLRQNPDISLMAANCAWQHHERFDGSGYPRGLREKEIHEFARIVAVADVYTAMTAKTPYRKAIPVYDTVALIAKTAGVYFDHEIVTHFMKKVVAFPLGANVRLNNRQIGVVIDHLDEAKTKPVVRLTLDENNQTISRVVRINYHNSPELYVAEVI